MVQPTRILVLMAEVVLEAALDPSLVGVNLAEETLVVEAEEMVSRSSPLEVHWRQRVKPSTIVSAQSLAADARHLQAPQTRMIPLLAPVALEVQHAHRDQILQTTAEIAAVIVEFPLSVQVLQVPAPALLQLEETKVVKAWARLTDRSVAVHLLTRTTLRRKESICVEKSS